MAHLMYLKAVNRRNNTHKMSNVYLRSFYSLYTQTTHLQHNIIHLLQHLVVYNLKLRKLEGILRQSLDDPKDLKIPLQVKAETFLVCSKSSAN